MQSLSSLVDLDDRLTFSIDRLSVSGGSKASISELVDVKEISTEDLAAALGMGGGATSADAGK